MVDKFERVINENYSGSQLEQVLNAYNILKSFNLTDPIYNANFGIGVANKLIDNKLDYISVISGLLFPILKNFKYSKLEKHNLNIEAISILKCLEIIENLDISTKEDQLEMVKKMFIGIAKDIRAIIIKLCVESEKLNYFKKFSALEQNEIMANYNDIFAPISAMLGMSQIKNELEDATFKFYKPKLYKDLQKALAEYVEERDENIKFVINKIKEKISPKISKCEVYGRQKKLASIAKKLQRKKMNVNAIIDIYGRDKANTEIINNGNFTDVSITHILDVLAVRVLVETVEQCYDVLGEIFSIFKPLGNYKDYIAHPKENGYQSIHTVVLLDNGDPVEIQIRTYEMHNYAEFGFAAHWAYKSNTKVKESDKKLNYIRSVLELYKQKSSDELLNILKTDVYSGSIFVRSPMGKIIEFPEGATTIDFAYAVHSKIGDSCIGAKINDKIVPLNTELNNGDVVEIITSPNSKGPSRDWLKMCKCVSTKNKINSFFKKEMKSSNIKKGKVILEAQCKLKNINLNLLLKEEFLQEVFERYSFKDIDDMYASIGYGGISSIQIINKLLQIYNDSTSKNLPELNINPTSKVQINEAKGSIIVRGYTNMLTKLAKCCNPIPGDDIVGYVSRGKGVTIHRTDCESINHCEFERLIECNWNLSNKGSFVGALTIIVTENIGALAKISKIIADMKISIAGISSRNIEFSKSQIFLQLYISNKSQLDLVINKLKNISFVQDIYRSI